MAVSATTNAGFDIVGASLVPYAGDYFIQVMNIILIIFGAIGFPVGHLSLFDSHVFIMYISVVFFSPHFFDVYWSNRYYLIFIDVHEKNGRR